MCLAIVALNITVSSGFRPFTKIEYDVRPATVEFQGRWAPVVDLATTHRVSLAAARGAC
jgi:hypothetical protein